MIQHWGRLRQWMSLEGAFRHWQENLRSQMRQWENTNCDQGALLRGKLLSDAMEWLQQKSADLSGAEKRYIQASRDCQNRQRQRLIYDLTFGIICALSLATFALWQWHKANYQQQQAILGRSESVQNAARIYINSGNELEALVQILETTESLPLLPQMQQQIQIIGLAAVMSGIRETNRLEGHQAGVDSISFRADGQILASGSADATVKIWQDRKLLQTLYGQD